jgi:hypothetical protein
VRARTDRLLADGYRRACSSLDAVVRAEVSAEYAEQMSRSGLWMRLSLRIRMNQEIKRRIHQKAPPDGLY